MPAPVYIVEKMPNGWTAKLSDGSSNCMGWSKTTADKAIKDLHKQLRREQQNKEYAERAELAGQQM